MNPPPLDLPTLISLVRSHTWLPVAIALVLYVRGLLSSSSRFPVTIPATWLPFATGLGTMVFSILVTVQGGASVGTALLASATTGTGAMVLDALAVALFGNDPSKVPVWMKFLLMLAHDVAPPATATEKRGFVTVRALLVATFAGVLVIGCLAAAKVIPPAFAGAGCVLEDAIAGKSIGQIEQDCGGDIGQVISVLVDPANYAKVKGTSAYAEAGRAKVVLAGAGQ